MLKALILVRPQRADVLCQRLLASGLVDDLSAVECRGYGRQKGHLETYRDSEYTIDFLPKVLVTALVAAEARDRLVDLVCATCRTGRIGDGKIFFVPLEQVTSLD
ncbi:MAG: P-II family nitrogen regulator [Planctomycetes bacterium]|nr:P-II family nitrogen regulator [Planctomycetota bacterium]